MKNKFLKNSAEGSGKSHAIARFWILLLIVMIVANLISCNSRSYIRNAGYDSYRIQILDTSNIFGCDSFSTESYFSLIKKLEMHMDLSPMVKGFDSLHVRVWCYYELSSTHHVLDIIKDKKGWRTELIEFSSNDLKPDPLIVKVNKRMKNLKPVNGWTSVANSLVKLKDKDLLVDKGGGIDGVTYCIEISDKFNYRFYPYFTPEITQNTNSTSKKLAEVLAQMEQEFSFKRLYID